MSSNKLHSKEKSDASLESQVEELLKPPEKLPLTSSPLDGEPETNLPHFGEKDYQSHRSAEFKVQHQLEPLPPKSKSHGKLLEQPQTIRTSHSNKSFAEATEELITSIAEESTADAADAVDGKERSVPKFTIGEEEGGEISANRSDSILEDKGGDVDAGPKTKDRSGSHKHRHHHHHHHHHSHGKNKRSMTSDPTERLRQGSDVNLKMQDISIRIGGDSDEDEEMNPAIRETMAVHRLGDMSGGGRHHHSSHRHSVSSFVHVRGRGSSSAGQMEKKKKKKEYDHRPHEVFVELDELYKEEGHEMQWKEKARWIKYEEDVEEGAQRWGKPHVASLSFHSLVELRQYLEHATAIFDLEESNLSNIFHRVVDNMIIADQIREEHRGDIMRALLLKHKHVNEHSGGILRNFSTISLGSVDDKKGDRHNEKHHHHSGILKNLSSISLTGHGHSHQKQGSDVTLPMLVTDGSTPVNGNTDSKGSTATPSGFKSTPSSTSLTRLARRLDHQRIEGIMRKIPEDAEVTSALVGEVDFLDTPAVSFVRLAEGAVLDNFSEVPIPVRFLFVMLVPTSSQINYHELGRSFSTLMSNDHFHQAAYTAETMRDLLTAMNTFIDHTIVLPPGDWDRELLLPVLRMQNEKMKKMRAEQQLLEEAEEMDGDLRIIDPTSKKRPPKRYPDPLKRTGKIFGGLINDICRRYPHYWSDIKDGLNFQCIAAFFFIYFAALSPAITFGGLMADKTENWIGVSETIIATAICGCFFAIFSGQPLTIIGVTGPILVFEENLYSFCVAQGIEYLPFRVWVGMWLFVIIVVMVAFEGSVLVQYFTRFTEEIFAFLIGLIFIYEVFNKLYRIFKVHPLLPDYCPISMTDSMGNYTDMWTETYEANSTSFMTVLGMNITDGGVCASAKVMVERQPNTALLSTILTLGTFFLAYFLRKFRQGRFLGKSARKMIGDFGIPISILVFVIVDFLIKAVYTQKLDMPDGLKPSDVCKRGWFVNPLGIEKPLNIGLMFAAAIPALLAFILMYMETLITGLIINKKDNRLKKGSGYHLDMFLLGIMAVFNGLMGLPLVWAATVRSVTHIGALSVFSKSHAPGEKPRLIKILEQRLTGLFIHIVIGASIAMAPLLRQVPLAVLFGVFLYMGVSSLNGIQMVERSSLLFMPVKHHPDSRYVREVRTWRMHVFTVIQLLCLGVLWIIKLTPAALCFSFFLILLVPIRQQLKRIFTKHELEALDCDEVDAGEDEDDEYQTVHMPQ
ncbi:band 3 anion transport protein-like [Diadema antillarum]|uniref:band 3 anion transport protein-like n=1 Tax=Diadema antillarum TaxID=105358 RepID=UPI003A860316